MADKYSLPMKFDRINFKHLLSVWVFLYHILEVQPSKETYPICSSCNCSSDLNNFVRIDCSGVKQVRLLTNLPNGTISLNASRTNTHFLHRLSLVPHISILDLSHNSLRTLPLSLSSSVGGTLVHLDLSYNFITGGHFAHLPSSCHTDLSGNSLLYRSIIQKQHPKPNKSMSPASRKKINEQKCTNVTFILNGINEWGSISLQKLFFHRRIFHDITHLSLESNNIIAIEAGFTDSLPNLKWLSLSKNSLADVCWGVLNELSSAPLLRELDVSHQSQRIGQDTNSSDSQNCLPISQKPMDLLDLTESNCFVRELSLPLGCFKLIKRLVCSNNSIVEIIWDAQNDEILDSDKGPDDQNELIYIDASYNNINNIGLDAIAHFNLKTPLLRPLSFLNVSHNNLLSINKIARMFLEGSAYGLSLDISHNPIETNCHMVHFTSWCISSERCTVTEDRFIDACRKEMRNNEQWVYWNKTRKAKRKFKKQRKQRLFMHVYPYTKHTTTAMNKREEQMYNVTENGTLILPATLDPNVDKHSQGEDTKLVIFSIGIPVGCGLFLGAVFGVVGVLRRTKKHKANATLYEPSYVNEEVIYSEPWQDENQDRAKNICTTYQPKTQPNNEYVNDIEMNPMSIETNIEDEQSNDQRRLGKPKEVRSVHYTRRCSEASKKIYTDSILPVRLSTDSAFCSFGGEIGLSDEKLSLDWDDIVQLKESHRLLSPVDVSSDSPFYVEDVLTEEGGRLELPAFRITMFIPPGAIPKGTRQRIFMHVYPDTKDTSTASNKRAQFISPFVICGPDGFKFENLITLSYPHYVTRLEEWQMKTIYTKTTNDKMKLDLLEEDPSCDALVQKDNVTLFLSHFTGFGTIGQQHTQASSRNEMNWKTILILTSQIIEGEDLILYIWCIDSSELDSVISEEEQQGKMRVSTNPFEVRVDQRSEEQSVITITLVDVDSAWSVYGPSLEDKKHQIVFTELLSRTRDSHEMVFLPDKNDVSTQFRCRLDIRTQFESKSVAVSASKKKQEQFQKSLEAIKLNSRPTSARGSLFNIDERNDLVEKLDTNENTICDNDWRILASYLKLTEREIEQIQQLSSRQSPTWKMLNLLECHLRNPGIQEVDDLLSFFKCLPKKQKRVDVERILEDVIFRRQTEADRSRTGIVRPQIREQPATKEAGDGLALAISPTLKPPILPNVTKEPTEQGIDDACNYLVWSDIIKDYIKPNAGARPKNPARRENASVNHGDTKHESENNEGMLQMMDLKPLAMLGRGGLSAKLVDTTHELPNNGGAQQRLPLKHSSIVTEPSSTLYLPSVLQSD